jgi:16S rRNA (guanine527-N7)-methyltransferase
MEKLFAKFPELTSKQKKMLLQLPDLYQEWNSLINVISRKDMEFFVERHLMHSMAIAKVIQFKAGTSILDIGTGGGFPGIPLAIMFPQCDFHLVDSIGKKIKVVNDVVEKLGLKNVRAEQIRAEQINESYDFIVSRAVTALPKFMGWTRNKIKQKKGFNAMPNGILYLKGGEFQEELEEVKKNYKLFPLSAYFEEEFFETKFLVYFKG